MFHYSRNSNPGVMSRVSPLVLRFLLILELFVILLISCIITFYLILDQSYFPNIYFTFWYCKVVKKYTHDVKTYKRILENFKIEIHV